jgi:small subunit ribosomal protein S15
LSKGDGSVESPWDPNLVLYYQQRIPLQGYYLISAWQEIPTSAIVGMLDTVRTSVLNMALEIKSEIGETDADLKKIAPQDAKKVDQTVTTYIYGGSVNISTGESAVNTATIQQQQNIVAGDWEHLAKGPSQLRCVRTRTARTLQGRRGRWTNAGLEGERLDYEDSAQGLKRRRKDRGHCWPDLASGISETILRAGVRAVARVHVSPPLHSHPPPVILTTVTTINRNSEQECTRLVLAREQKKSVIDQYQTHATDTGSPEVQIAIISERIGQLTDHFKMHQKDHGSRRGLLMLVSKRRRLLDYLKRYDSERYKTVIGKLGIRK